MCSRRRYPSELLNLSIRQPHVSQCGQYRRASFRVDVPTTPGFNGSRHKIVLSLASAVVGQ
jgi:hypothetical protein